MRAGSKGSVRIRGMAVVQLPARVREGLQSMMKVSSLPLANLQRSSILRRSSAAPVRVAAVNVAPRLGERGVSVSIAPLLARLSEAEAEGAEEARPVRVQLQLEPDAPLRPVRLHLDTARIAAPASPQVCLCACGPLTAAT
jgi:hypothetical protein